MSLGYVIDNVQEIMLLAEKSNPTMFYFYDTALSPPCRSVARLAWIQLYSAKAARGIYATGAGPP